MKILSESTGLDRYVKSKIAGCSRIVRTTDGKVRFKHDPEVIVNAMNTRAIVNRVLGKNKHV